MGWGYPQRIIYIQICLLKRLEIKSPSRKVCYSPKKHPHCKGPDMQIKPFGFYDQIVRMKHNADKFELRLRMLQFAKQYGVKPAARAFATTPKTVRKWLGRYRQERLAGLNELPRIPLSCPHKIPPTLEQKIVRLRKQFPFMGAKRLRREHHLTCSHQAIARVLKTYGLIQKRRKNTKRKTTCLNSNSAGSSSDSFLSIPKNFGTSFITGPK